MPGHDGAPKVKGQVVSVLTGNPLLAIAPPSHHLVLPDSPVCRKSGYARLIAILVQAVTQLQFTRPYNYNMQDKAGHDTIARL